MTVVGVRVLSMWMPEGYHPVRSRVGWQLWATERLMDAARNYLFPIYASLLTPWWLRRAGRESGPGHRDLDGAADPEVHRRRGRRVPGRRHHGRVLRTGRRLDPRRQGDDRQAGIPRQLGHHPAGPPSARRRAGRGAVGSAAQGQGGLVVVGQPAGSVAPQAHRGRRAAYLPPVPAAEDPARVGGNMPADPDDRDVRDRCGCAVRAAVAGGRSPAGRGPRWPAAWCCWPRARSPAASP